MQRLSFFTVTFILIAVALSPLAGAAETNSFHFLALYGKRLQQEKPVALNSLNGHFAILSFWRSDCAPCLREVSILPTIAKAYPALPIVLVSIQDAGHTRPYLSDTIPANMHIWIAQGDAKDVLSAFGNDKPVLPFSVVLQADGRICDQHYGILGTDIVSRWMKTC